MSTDKIKELRNVIPIGIAEAKDLLDASGFDINVAERSWCAQRTEQLAELLSIDKEYAKKLLEEVNYDSRKAQDNYSQNTTLLIDKILQSSNFDMDVVRNLLSNFNFVINDGVDYKTGIWNGREKSYKLTVEMQDLIKMLTWYNSAAWSQKEFSKEVIPILKQNIGFVEFFDELNWFIENEKEGYEVLKLKSKLNPNNIIRHRKFKREFSQNIKKSQSKLIEFITLNKLKIQEALNKVKV